MGVYMVKKTGATKSVEVESTPEATTVLASAPMNPSPTLRDKGVYFLSGGFNSETASKVVTWILEANLSSRNDFDHLNLIINSPGGEVNSAFAIIDAMEGSAIPVHTTGLGMIGSCGFLTFIAGTKGHRILTPNTSILSHEWSWGSRGKAHELFAVQREFELTQSRMVNHYKKHTGLKKKKILKKLLPPHDVWLSAEDAVALGAADAIKVMGQGN
jgi:ATP-dependent Clp protease, protease subunit